MPEYTQIANLRGPRGPRALTESILLDPESDDLDNLDPEVYRVNTPNAAAALGLPVAMAGSLEVLMSSFSTRIQRFTASPGAGGGRVETWKRSMSNLGEWGEWYKTPEADEIVGSDSIRSVRTTQNPLEPANPGELLLVVPPVPAGSTYLDEFDSGSIGSTPGGWTPRWQTDVNWELVTSESATGGRALRFGNGVDTSGRWALSMDALDADGQRVDVELVVKWQRVDGGVAHLPRLFSRGAGSDGSETAYWGPYNTGSSAGFGKDVEGSTTWPIGTSSGDNATGHNTWFITRFRVVEDRLAGRTWPASDPEPSTWTETAQDTDITGAGWIGLSFGSTSAVVHFDWVGAATGGRTAPMGPAS